MAIAKVQDNTTGLITATGNPLTATLGFSSGITAGNAVFVLITLLSSSTRTFTVSDGTGAVYTKLLDVAHTTGYVCNGEIWVCANHSGGSAAPVITHNNASGDFKCSAIEMSGFGGTVELISSDVVDESVVSNSHISSSAGLTTARECVAVVMGGTGGPTFTNSVEGTGYTKIPTSYTSTTTYHAQKIFASGCTAEQGAWTHTGTARDVTSWVALIGPPAGGGGGSSKVIVIAHRR